MVMEHEVVDFKRSYLDFLRCSNASLAEAGVPVAVAGPWSRKKIERKAATLSRRAERLGLPPFSVDVVEREVHVSAQSLPYLEVAIHGHTPVLNGWTVLALKERVAGTGEFVLNRILRSGEVEGYFDAIRPYYENHSCNHCKIHRSRNKFFILRNDSTGEVKQVGSSCLASFSSLFVISDYIKNCCLFGDVSGDASEDQVDDYFKVGNYSQYISSFLAHAFRTVKQHGYCKAAEEDNNRLPSGMVAWYSLEPERGNPLCYTGEDFRVVALPEDYEDAKLALEWLESQRGTVSSDYMANLLSVARAGLVDYRRRNLVASLASVYLRHANKRSEDAEMAKRSLNEHFGEVKGRYELKLKVLGHHAFPSSFGETHLYKFTDPEGRSYVWFASSEQDFLNGAEYLVKATVKDHNLRDGRLQTILTRVTRICLA
jgi:hypothetical protein